ncbi:MULTISPECIES: hypothetical protein [unclassified Lentilitoribacter]|jgi:hypothetical protein|uniref:hypothetical protein n=1 Tax=unclassified Lentilitoribacter TaxID=2647570 RepID=UPI0013A6E1A9|nr:hypothetical protein [Lentilitoribacter sp. Alg239-R112]
MNVSDASIEDILSSLESYGDLAGSEVLTRALIAERNGERDKALFWFDVFKKLANQESQLTTI